jgi:hypothetical protein
MVQWVVMQAERERRGIMAHARFSGEEIARRGKELYEQRLRPLIETEENIGKIVSIDIETGDYHIDRDLLLSAGYLHEKHPGAAVWSERIGYDAVYALGGGSISRLAK